MQKYILLALLATCAVTEEVIRDFYTQDHFNHLGYLHYGNYFSLDFAQLFDINYGTGYEAGPYEGDDEVVDGFQYEKYYAYFTVDNVLAYKVTFFDYYSYDFKWTTNFLTVHPYEQYFIWYRPEAQDYDWETFDFNIFGSFYWEALRNYATVTESLRTCKWSVLAAILDEDTPYPTEFYDSHCKFTDVEYEDPYWYIDIMQEHLFPKYDSLSVLKENYGEIDIYNWWVLGKYDW